MKYAHTDELAWAPYDEVDDDLVKKFESLSPSSSVPPSSSSSSLRRSVRNKSSVAAPVPDKKRKIENNGYVIIDLFIFFF